MDEEEKRLLKYRHWVVLCAYVTAMLDLSKRCKDELYEDDTWIREKLSTIETDLSILQYHTGLYARDIFEKYA